MARVMACTGVAMARDRIQPIRPASSMAAAPPSSRVVRIVAILPSATTISASDQVFEALTTLAAAVRTMSIEARSAGSTTLAMAWSWVAGFPASSISGSRVWVRQLAAAWSSSSSMPRISVWPAAFLRAATMASV